MHKSLIVILVAIITSGCASIKHQPLSSESVGDLQGKSITNSKYEKPDFAASTAGKATFAVVGAFAVISAGNKLIHNNDVADPAVRIGEDLINDLAKKYRMNVVENTEIISSSNEVSELSSLHAASNYIVDVQTINWSFVYFPTDWNSYRVIYTARMRLIDSNSKEVVAEEFCKRIPEYEDSDDAPSYDYLVDDNAKGLKLELREAEKFCVDYFKKTAYLM